MPSSPSTEHGILGNRATEELCQVRHNSHTRHQAGIPSHTGRSQVTKTDLALSAAQGGRRDLRDALFSQNCSLASCPKRRALNTAKALLIWFSCPKGDMEVYWPALHREEPSILTAVWGQTPKKEPYPPTPNPGLPPITCFLPSEESCFSCEHGQHQLAEHTAGTSPSSPLGRVDSMSQNQKAIRLVHAATKIQNRV